MTQTVDTIDALTRRIRILQAEQSSGQRLMIGIVGAPGAGKSTLAAELCHRLNEFRSAEPRAAEPRSAQPRSTETGGTTCSAAQGGLAVVVPMDGFHLDNAILASRSLMSVKGSPDTFDVDGLSVLLERLLAAPKKPIYVPVFDRQADLARNAAQRVDERHAILLVEGNYLLLQRSGWQSLAPRFHLSIMLDVPMPVLEQRLIQRWLDHGLDDESARRRALSNDIPNAHTVLSESAAPDLRYQSMRE